MWEGSILCTRGQKMRCNYTALMSVIRLVGGFVYRDTAICQKRKLLRVRILTNGHFHGQIIINIVSRIGKSINFSMKFKCSISKNFFLFLFVISSHFHLRLDGCVYVPTWTCMRNWMIGEKEEKRREMRGAFKKSFGQGERSHEHVLSFKKMDRSWN